MDKENTLLITGGSGFIGTNLIEFYEKGNYNIINFDKSKPKKESHSKYWVQGNLLDKRSLEDVINKYKPNIVIHLAAKTDTSSDYLGDYKDNTEGTQNLLEIIQGNDSITQVIITSTQYVYKSNQNPIPNTDESYSPFTVYGQSKVIVEKLTRSANLKCVWTIIRPVNIWGPWHMRYPNELWRLIHQGRYIHPKNGRVIRTYGYVKNVVYHIHKIIIAPAEEVNKKTFYVGDLPMDSYTWVSELGKRMGKKKIHKIPNSLLKYLSMFGDILRKYNVAFPLYSSRFQNMTEDYYAPTSLTINKFGIYQSNLEINVNETIDWLESEGKKYFEYWRKQKNINL